MKTFLNVLIMSSIVSSFALVSNAQEVCPNSEAPVRSNVCRDRYASDKSLKTSDRDLMVDLLTELEMPSMGSGLRWFRTTFSEEGGAFKMMTDAVMDLKLPEVPARKAARRTHDAIASAYDQGHFCPKDGGLLTFQQAKDLVLSKIKGTR